VSRTALLRALGLGLPLLLTAALLWWRSGHRRRSAGALLSLAWVFPSLAAVNGLALSLGWWRFEAEGPRIAGLPIDLFVGWSLLWGTLPALAARRSHPAVVLAVLLWLDLLIMPACAPLLQLGPGWLMGEALLLLLVALPALMLARWVRDDRQLNPRVTLLAGAFGLMSLWLLPQTAHELLPRFGIRLTSDGHRWQLSRDGGLLLQLAFLAALPGLSAAQEFVERGAGTPIPYDPPKQLVRSGIYSFIANPMQLSMTLTFIAWAGLIGSPVMLLVAVLAFLYGAGIADWHERGQLAQRYGRPWEEYRVAVPLWCPRLRPYRHPELPPARLYAGLRCGPCSALARWFDQRSPIGLKLIPAEHHPHRDLRRLTYDPGDGGAEEHGIAALARALEHLNIGWAILGMGLRLPGIRSLAQLLADVSGAGPKLVLRDPSCPRFPLAESS